VAKEYFPNLVVSGGRNGNEVTSIRSKPNSFIRGNSNHVFETDDQGKVLRDIDPDRVKVRETHRNQAGEIFVKMEKIGPPAPEDLEILRKMGVIK